MATYQFKRFKQLHLQLVLASWNEPWLGQAELAQRFGLTVPWVSQILGSPEAEAIRAQLEARTVDTIMDVQTQIQAIAPAALKAQIDLAFNDNTPPSTRSKILNQLLEMAGHSPIKRVQVSRDDPALERLNSMTDAEIMDELLKTAGADDTKKIVH